MNLLKCCRLLMGSKLSVSETVQQYFMVDESYTQVVTNWFIP